MKWALRCGYAIDLWVALETSLALYQHQTAPPAGVCVLLLLSCIAAPFMVWHLRSLGLPRAALASIFLPPVFLLLIAVLTPPITFSDPSPYRGEAVVIDPPPPLPNHVPRETKK